jgi:CIC family chloride channel protein
MFAPTLFVGAMLGGAVGGVERALYPGLTGSTATYALVGMGVLFAAFLRVPMTSVFMVLEVSGNYSIIVPVILANTLAYLISRGLEPVPIFDLLTRQDGLDLPSLEEQREQTVLRVEDAMKPAPTPVLEAQYSVDQALRRVQDLTGTFLVRMSPSGRGSVTPDTLNRLVGEGKGELSLGSALPVRNLPYLHPDLTLEAALRHVYHVPLVPVVHRADFRRLEGVISREDVLEKYKEQEDD